MISCDRCGKKIETSILATSYASGSVQIYYACPFCLTRMRKATEKIGKATKTLPLRIRDKSTHAEILWKPGPKVKYHNPDAWISHLRS